MSSVPTQTKELFASAAMLSETERGAWLDSACGDDAALRAEIVSLLAAHDRAGDFLVERHSPATHIEEQIGPYRLIEKLGEGGMGEVYVAEQSRPLRRQVALKIVKRGMDSREVLARFDAERQALALMDHPHIAKVLDGGMTESGRPYFVMELVNGEPVTVQADAARLPIRERLRLFVQICRALQHAHQRGIIHRDLKPSNVLVAQVDATTVPKVIDFGVAKALNQQLSEDSLYTRAAQMIGTPLYMSPEQASLGSIDVDTRSDVYSLGVLLYELLVGTTPFDRDLLKRAGFDEMRRIIRDEEPPRPSARIGSCETAQTVELAACRAIDARQHQQMLRSELDWIAVKALEKDRERRYQSAAELADDVQRYLDGDTVAACPPSRVYRTRKYVRRHAGALTAVLLIAAALIVGTAVSIWQAVEAIDARQLAEKRLGIANEARRQGEESQELARTRLYVAQMNLASDALTKREVRRASNYLAGHIPREGERDLRGYEWYHYMSQVEQPPSVTIDAGPWDADPAGSWVNDVACSPDGKVVAVCAALATVRLYDLQTRKLMQTLNTPDGVESVNGLDWSSDGRLIAGACADGKIRIWNVATGKEQTVIPAHTGEVNDVLFSRDATSLFSCGVDETVCRWDASTGERRATFVGHTEQVRQITLSPDGSRLATAGNDETVAIWDAENGKRIHPVKLGQAISAKVACVSFSPHGRYVAAGNVKGWVILADTATGEHQVLQHHRDDIGALVFLPDGKRLAAADRGGTIQIHSLPERFGDKPVSSTKIHSQWVAHQERILALAVTSDGTRIVSGGREGLVRIWQPEPRETIWAMNNVPEGCYVAVAENGQLFAAGREIYAWDLKERKRQGAFGAVDSPWMELGCSRDGRYLAAARVGELALFDVSAQRMLQQWRLDPSINPYAVAISNDGQWVALVDYEDDSYVALYRRTDREGPRRISANQSDYVAFSPDGRWLVIDDAKDLLLFDLSEINSTPDDLPAPHRLVGHYNAVREFVFSGDGELLASVGADRRLLVWQLSSTKLLLDIAAHETSVECVAFSHDGRTIATSGDYDRIKLWHTETGQPLGQLTARRSGINHLAFGPDDRMIVAQDEVEVVVYDASPNVQTHVSVAATAPAASFDVEFVGLGLGLINQPLGPYPSYGSALSADGETVASYFHRASKERRKLNQLAERFRYPFTWHAAAGRTLYQRPTRKNASGIFHGLSDDGLILCGAARANPKINSWQAWVWTAPDESQAVAPHPSSAKDISADGQVIVGRQFRNGHWIAFRWDNGVLRSLTAPHNGQHVCANAVSPDGRVVLGVSFSGGEFGRVHGRHSLLHDSESFADVRPLLWKNNQFESLSGFDVNYNWWPTDCSDDGSVIIGVRWPRGQKHTAATVAGRGVAFRGEAGRVALLENLPDHDVSIANRISGDGRVIVGQCRRAGGTESMHTAVVWGTANEARDLNQVLLLQSDERSHWRLTNACGVSRDGDALTGHGYGPCHDMEAWWARVPREVLRD